MSESYSKEGPKCPYFGCGRQFTADDKFYYTMTLLECDECGRTSTVQVETETTWICEEIDDT